MHIDVQSLNASICNNHLHIILLFYVFTHSGVLTEANGIAAVAGVNVNETHYTPIPSSGTQNIISIASTSNVNVSGVWIFQLDGDKSASMWIITFCY